MTTIQVTPPRLRYTVVVREDQATDGAPIWVAEYPELPGCMSHGETREEAVQNLQEAAQLYLEALEESGQTPPTPSVSHTTSGTAFTGVSLAAAASVEVELEGLAIVRR